MNAELNARIADHISVIIPVHNGGEDFRRCLDSLGQSTRLPDELIVVDDVSTDASALAAQHAHAQVLTLTGTPHGPAFARNVGASVAKGNLLVFIDADVVVHANTLSKIAEYFDQAPAIAALFGSYDDTPAATNWVSQYKNLQHHFVHQHSKREAATFWAGCGAIRSEIFVALGGFSTQYTRPSIEDIELGVRLKQAGHTIWLCKDVLVTHLKHWTLPSLLRADIFGRAVPWTKLILSSGQLPADLNLNAANRISALTALALMPLCVLGFWLPSAWLVALAALGIIVVLNANLYALFIRRGGILFAGAALGLHLLYFLYSTVVFGTLSAFAFVGRVSRKLAHVT